MNRSAVLMAGAALVLLASSCGAQHEARIDRHRQSSVFGGLRAGKPPPAARPVGGNPRDRHGRKQDPRRAVGPEGVRSRGPEDPADGRADVSELRYPAVRATT